MVSYQWDASNNLERLTWPDGYAVDYDWDANNRIDLALNGATVLADVAYDEQSRRDSVAYGNGTNVLYTFSARGDLENHDHYFTAAAVNYGFTYNGVGQMETKILSDPSYGWAAPTTGTSVYAVNGLNQYIDIDGIAPVHDANGNLESDPQGRSFSYDAENVLRSVTGLTGGTASYRYHADGSRREKSHSGTTSTFFYMGGLGYLDAGDTAFAADQEIAEYEGGTLKRRFIRLPGSIDEAFLMIDVATGSETWAHMDRLGSVIATTDSSGTVEDTYRYSPYGEPGSEGTGGFPFRFTGQRLDQETGLYYYKARYYDPDVGRFLQTDPIGYDDQMNLYAYVGNDPVNGKDPSGMAQCASSLSEDQCNTALDASDTARDAARNVASGLRELANDVDSGELSEADNELLGEIEELLGSKFTSPRALKRLAKRLDKAADKIGERGTGATLRHGGNSGPLGGTRNVPSAYVLSSFGGAKSIHLNDKFFGYDSDVRERIILHEGAHMAGAWRDRYIRGGKNKLHNKTFPFFGAQRNADTYACITYPSTCGY